MLVLGSVMSINVFDLSRRYIKNCGDGKMISFKSHKFHTPVRKRIISEWFPSYLTT